MWLCPTRDRRLPHDPPLGTVVLGRRDVEQWREDFVGQMGYVWMLQRVQIEMIDALMVVRMGGRSD